MRERALTSKLVLALAPSTMLRMVPLPRFAVEEPIRARMREPRRG